MSDQIGTILLRLRIVHNDYRMRGRMRASESIAHHVLDQYRAKLLPSGEYELEVAYRTDHDLDDIMDDLLFEIAGEAQLRGCFSETEARLKGSQRQW